MKKLLLFTLMLTGFTGVYHSYGALRINELMQSNIDCIKDDLNEFPDSWVELYNPDNETINLGSYSICDKNKPGKAYALPSRNVNPGEYLIIYCDKENTGLHTDFRLESGKGGEIYLFRNGEVADYVEKLPKQPAPNVSYGYQTDGSGKSGYQAIPTPGAPNCGRLVEEVLPEPVFSAKGSVGTSVTELSLSIPEGTPAGAEIRYTLDGKEPVATSLLYTAPIKISGTTTVRAKIYCDGYISPRSTTHSYIRHPRSMSLPVISIVTDNDYFYSDKMGIYVKGTYSSGKANYEYDWRRPINIEYFTEPNAGSVFNQLCETRVKGGQSRNNVLKSLVIYANKRFGIKRFNYEFFPTQTPGIEEYKSFELRNAGNDFDYMYMRDAIIQRSMGMNVDLDWQPSQPAIIYINGVYKGILNLRTRSNEDYIYSYYDGLEDIDMIENWNELKEGTLDNYNAFTEFYSAPGHTFSEYAAQMDLGEYCNMMIMNTFYDNKDFPGNNIVMWRPREEGGKWRWVAKDTDFGMGLYGERYSYPTLSWITTPGYDNNRNEWANKAEHSLLFRRLLDIPEFKDLYIDRTSVYLGDFLRPEKVSELIDARYNELKDEYKAHRDPINPWWPNFSQEINSGKTWMRQRWGFYYTHLASFFNLSNPVDLTVDKGKNKKRTLIINDIECRADEFNGKYYPGRKLKVSSVSDTDGLYVNGWEVTLYNGGATTSHTYDTETLNIDMPEGSRVEIVSILSTKPLSVDAIEGEPDPDQPFEIYDITGRYLGSTMNPEIETTVPGLYLMRQGKFVRKVIVK